MLLVIDAGGGARRYEYDWMGRLTRETDPTGGVRTIHVYADSTTDKADAVSSVAEALRPLKTTVTVTADPAFEGVAHLRP